MIFRKENCNICVEEHEHVAKIFMVRMNSIVRTFGQAYAY